ncbi:GH1 family beta-glucosidase [Chitinophaga rhizophila]|uniref:Beta-glucosidase n=1 Tax=Chitinophaga rhizophila TaxID=2866212 RepID=A0ABS7G8V4_9BACT|nr:GH1 family beta-glucosidase [Chitinophaga rhizophila]MBW8684108.1 beta-glucosidase [Chitinophaga rhizophila]
MEQFSAPFSRHDFGENFLWGVTISAFQNEGACDADGKGKSIWDEFTRKKGKIKDGANALITVDFYNRYKEDILLVKQMGFNVFRFSISWPRILPDGTGQVNAAGIAFYHRVIDACLEAGLIPYITLYHWDLPHALEQKGGWCHRGVIFAFEEYVRICVEAFGDKVKNWIVMNEPFGFTSLGYMLGVHAPGKFGVSYFLPAVHHVLLAQAAGAKVIRETVKGANIGTSLSCSYIYPYTQQEADIQAARKADALFNRLFIEPVLGMGYPVDSFPLLRRIERRYALWRDWDQLSFDFDFIGIQNYFPLVVRRNAFMPVVGISEVKPKIRKVPMTALGWEISGEGMYAILKQFGAYKDIRRMMVTESGAAFADIMSGGKIDDQDRIRYFSEYLEGVLKAKREGIPVDGYFAWTLTDNFEWAEGYRARFGLVHVDRDTQIRTMKSSGQWFSWLLNA